MHARKIRPTETSVVTGITVSNEQIKSKMHEMIPRLKQNAHTQNCRRILCFISLSSTVVLCMYDFYTTDNFNLIASNFMCNNKLIVNMNLLKIVEIV